MKILKNTSISLFGICIVCSIVCASCNKTPPLTPITDDILDLASATGDPFLAELLYSLQTGNEVDVNKKNPYPKKADENQFTGLHYAAGLGDPRIIKILVERGAHVNTATDKGFTPLHGAVQFNKPVSISTLLECSALDPNGEWEPAPNFKGLTPLFLAIATTNLAIIKLLIADGRVKINQSFQFSGQSTTPLKFAQLVHDNEADPAKKARLKAIIDVLKDKGATL